LLKVVARAAPTTADPACVRVRSCTRPPSAAALETDAAATRTAKRSAARECPTRDLIILLSSAGSTRRRRTLRRNGQNLRSQKAPFSVRYGSCIHNSRPICLQLRDAADDLRAASWKRTGEVEIADEPANVAADSREPLARAERAQLEEIVAALCPSRTSRRRVLTHRIGVARVRRLGGCAQPRDDETSSTWHLRGPCMADYGNAARWPLRECELLLS